MLQFQPQIKAAEAGADFAVELAARAGTGFAQYPRLSRQAGGICGATLRQRVLRGAEDDQLIGQPGLDHQIAMGNFAFDQAEVALEAQQLADDGFGVGHMQAHRRAGMLLHVVGDDQRRQIVADGEGGADLQRSEVAATEIGLYIAGLRQQVFRQRQQATAGGVEVEAFADAVEERAVELPLQLQQRAAGGGLGHRQRQRGFRDIFGAGDDGKDLKLAQRQPHIDSIDN